MCRLHFSLKLLISVVVFSIIMIFVTSTAAKDRIITLDISTIGSRTDGSWSQSYYEAYLYIQKKYPEVKVTFSDLNPFAEMPSILEAKAQKGLDMIYLDSAWYEALQKVAPKYPKVWFVDGIPAPSKMAKLSDNVTTYFQSPAHGGFLAGVAAGMVTKTNIIGYIMGADYPDIIRTGKTFELGAKLVNPKVKLLTLVTGDWVDVQKGYESAKALIESGADVLMHYSDNAGKGVFKAAIERKIYVIGECRDQVEFAPNLMITSFLIDHPRLLEKALLDFKSGTIKKGIQMFGIEQGWPVIAPIRNVPTNVETKVKEVMESIKKGEIKMPVLE